MKRITYILPLTLAATLLTASTALAQTAGNPQLQVVTPSDGQTIYGSRVPILFSVQNFTIVEKPNNTTAQNNQGYILIWLDDKNAAADTATQVTADSFTYSDVAYGDHTLKAELVTTNNKPLIPPQETTVNFKNAPITSPTPAATEGFDKNTTLVILIVVALVIVAAWWYTREETEEEPQDKTSKPKPTKKTSKSKSGKSKRAKRK
jgi:hypothetical protein